MWTMFNIALSVREKLLIAVMLLGIGVAGGWTLHSMWDAWISQGSLKNQIKVAQAAPAKIINFNQAMRKTNAHKDKCFNEPIPADVLNLLRK